MGGVRAAATAGHRAVGGTTTGVIEFRDVSKTYAAPLRRAVRAVEGFSLRVEAGEVLGLAGPNGAGKSTLINLLLGYLAPSGGAVTIAGETPRTYIERSGIGFLPELVHVSQKWTLRGALVRFAVLGGVARTEVPERVDSAIARLGLEEHRDKRVKALSKGTLQRLGIAQVLLRDDDVMILDEPTHGLDPVWTLRFRDLVQDLRRPGRATLIASHNLDELQRVADRVAIIDRGRLQRVVDVRRRQVAAATKYRLSLAAGDELVAGVFPGSASLGGGEFEVPSADLATLNRGLRDLLARGAVIAAVVPARSALEEEFRSAVGESTA